MPIIGTTAGQISGQIFTSDYESIATVTLATSSSTVTFSSIPNTYKYLQVRWIARGTFGEASVGQKANFNSDASSIYTTKLIRGDGGTFYVDEASAGTSMANIGRASASTATSGMFAGFIMDISDYANTSKYKVARCYGGSDRNGSGEIRINSSMWMSTAAISSITIAPTDGGSYEQYTRFALYGMKG